MIGFIIGNKGSGKTKRLIDKANTAVEQSKGNVVCVEKGKKLIYELKHGVRLIDTDAYNISGFEAFYGILAGVCACDYDLTDVFVDATLRIGSRDYEEFADFTEKLNKVASETQTNFVFTVSCDESELPERIFKVAEKI